MTRNILVVGPQHSCTRLVTALVDRHPDVTTVTHWSIPQNKPAEFEFPAKQYTEKCDKIVVVNRDSNAIDISNIKDGYKLNDDESQNLSCVSKNIIKEGIKQLDANKIVFVSLEMLADYREQYMRQFLMCLELDTNKYDFNLSGRYVFDPPRWYTVDLNIIDPNRKYLKRFK